MARSQKKIWGQLFRGVLSGRLAFLRCATPRWIGIYFWKPFSELLLDWRQLLLRGEVCPFVGIGPEIIKLLRSFIIPDVTIVVGSDGVIVFTMSSEGRSLPFGVWIHEKRGKACSVETFSSGQAAEIDKGGVDAEKLCRAGATRSLVHGRCGDDEGHSGSALPERLLGPTLLFSKEEPVIRVEDDHSVSGVGTFFESIQKAADLLVC